MNKRMCGPSFETPRKDARLLRMTRHVTAYWLAMTELSIGAGARLRCQLCERRACIDDLAADHRQHRSDFSDLLDRRGQIVRRQHREIGEFAGLERAALVVVVGHQNTGRPERPRSAPVLSSASDCPGRRCRDAAPSI